MYGINLLLKFSIRMNHSQIIEVRPFSVSQANLIRETHPTRIHV